MEDSVWDGDNGAPGKCDIRDREDRSPRRYCAHNASGWTEIRIGTPSSPGNSCTWDALQALRVAEARSQSEIRGPATGPGREIDRYDLSDRIGILPAGTMRRIDDGLRLVLSLFQKPCLPTQFWTFNPGTR